MGVCSSCQEDPLPPLPDYVEPEEPEPPGWLVDGTKVLVAPNGKHLQVPPNRGGLPRLRYTTSETEQWTFTQVPNHGDGGVYNIQGSLEPGGYLQAKKDGSVVVGEESNEEARWTLIQGGEDMEDHAIALRGCYGKTLNCTETGEVLATLLLTALPT